MTCSTLTAGREFWHQRSRTEADGDATFLEFARQGHYGPEVAEHAAELCIDLDTWPDDDPTDAADRLIERVNAAQIADEED